jgi:sugar lactone lactonase YvrE
LGILHDGSGELACLFGVFCRFAIAIHIDCQRRVAEFRQLPGAATGVVIQAPPFMHHKDSGALAGGRVVPRQKALHLRTPLRIRHFFGLDRRFQGGREKNDCENAKNEEAFHHVQVPRTFRFSNQSYAIFVGLVSMSDVASYQAQNDPFNGLIERLDPALDELIPAASGVETICEGFIWTEGPVWKDSALFFSDVPANILYRWTPGSGQAEVFLEPSGGIPRNPNFVEPGSNGLALDSEGRLLLCQHGARRVVRLEDDGRTQTVLADRFEGRRLNNPNDLVCHSSGAVYFTDPSYGFAERDASPLKEIPWNGVYRIAPDRTVALLTKDLPFPNGLAFGPDEKTLYVAVSDASLPRIVAFDVTVTACSARAACSSMQSPC